MPRALTVNFTAPRQVEIRAHEQPAPGPGQVLVRTVASAISAGSEMLVYRGEFPHEPLNPHDPLSTDLHYPLTYGYACVGRVVDLGRSVDEAWRDQTVFAFQPHASHFAISPDGLLVVPSSVDAEAACFLPSMETAVNLVQDAAPLVGERALVLGQGIVGLLVAALLSEFLLDSIVTADLHPLRRDASQRLATHGSLDPTAGSFLTDALELLGGPADLSIELSGSPAALDQALALTGFGGRVIVGSWYGAKRAPLDLGGQFHRSRIRLISSQVSTIAPKLTGAWDKPRRFQTAWRLLERLRPQAWISHRYPIEEAAEAYRMLDQHPEAALQVIFTYA
jgi:2-desacetyl-2-hydroxyethyl bacteriochlorophyllide A dehydrogenase